MVRLSRIACMLAALTVPSNALAQLLGRWNSAVKAAWALKRPVKAFSFEGAGSDQLAEGPSRGNKRGATVGGDNPNDSGEREGPYGPKGRLRPEDPKPYAGGLSNGAAIRELYLDGNKISDVEGLHRLQKLAVLDLSFNKITTTKALGQLVANYSSLRALNLVGNAVQKNIGDDALRKAVAGLLPLLEYLNKQPVRPQRAREAAKDSVAKAALGGNSGWSSRRRASKSSRRLSQSPGSSAKNRGREGSGSTRSRSKSRPHQGSSLARM
ncbi:hypothetical protein GUJ93_ZPchr0009g572 [Zizania palustris]|uniref:Uncharacterized protein n=1 Tax=Zizania palustris TaxID=103762 RepID=A0A8J5V4P5_ZIZPA|nr:hypothetical protein GUJ93_ZPchr0009g572 [Zizania palustris]